MIFFNDFSYWGTYVKIECWTQGLGIYYVRSTKQFIDEVITVSILVETLNVEGETSTDRQYAFRQSYLYGNDHIPFATLNLRCI